MVEAFRDYLSVFGPEEKLGEKFKNFKRILKESKHFANYPFAQDVIAWLKEYEHHMTTIIQSKRTMNHTISQLHSLTDQMHAAMKSKDLDQYKILGRQLKHYNEQYVMAKKDLNKESDIRNPFYKKSNWLFTLRGLLKNFDETSIKHIIALDMDKIWYTYLSIPDSKIDDWEFIAYFALHMKPSAEPVKLTEYEFQMYQHFAYNGPDFEELTKNLTDYMRTNSAASMLKVLELMKKFPGLIDENNEKKKHIKEVYRGVNLDTDDDDHEYEEDTNDFDEDEEDSGRERFPLRDDLDDKTKKRIIKKDRAREYVATSEWKNAAKNFALQKGHMTADRGNKAGAVIAYDVAPKDIILVVDIFGSKWGESEVIINPRTAKVAKIWRV